MKTTTSPSSNRALLTLLSATCGFSAASVYLNQPLLVQLENNFPQSLQWVGLVPAMTQLGYALGILLIAPLGDRFNRRTLVLCQIAGLCIALGISSIAPVLPALIAASFAVGICATASQQAIPYAVEVAKPGETGKAVGIVMMGLALGIVLARTASGTIAQHAGWRMVFVAAMAVMAVLLAILAKQLPSTVARSDLSYRQLLLSMYRLMRDEPLLRNNAITGAALFAAFSAFWSVLALFVAQPPLNLGPQAAGLFGVVGALGAALAPLVGSTADKHGPKTVVTMSVGLVALGFVILAMGSTSIAALVAGVIVLDLGVQAGQISGRSSIYGLRDDARSRINAAYMVCYFAGGALGATLGSLAWQHFGWPGVCTVGLAASAIAAINHLRPQVVSTGIAEEPTR